MKLTNNEIYTIAQNMINNLSDLQIYIPAKANFAIQKNINTITTFAQDIDNARIDVIKHYGELQEDQDQYIVPESNMDIATKEINDLFALEQDLKIYTFSLQDLGNAEFTPAQMQTIMFMIDED